MFKLLRKLFWIDKKPKSEIRPPYNPDDYVTNTYQTNTPATVTGTVSTSPVGPEDSLSVETNEKTGVTTVTTKTKREGPEHDEDETEVLRQKTPETQLQKDMDQLIKRNEEYRADAAEDKRNEYVERPDGRPTKVNDPEVDSDGYITHTFKTTPDPNYSIASILPSSPTDSVSVMTDPLTGVSTFTTRYRPKPPYVHPAPHASVGTPIISDDAKKRKLDEEYKKRMIDRAREEDEERARQRRVNEDIYYRNSLAASNAYPTYDYQQQDYSGRTFNVSKSDSPVYEGGGSSGSWSSSDSSSSSSSSSDSGGGGAGSD